MISDINTKRFKISVIGVLMAVVLHVLVCSIPFASANTGVAWLEPANGYELGNNVDEDQFFTFRTAFKNLFDRCGYGYQDYYICINTLGYNNFGELHVQGEMYPSSGYNWTEKYLEYNSVYYNIYTCDSVYVFDLSLSTLNSMDTVNFSTNTAYYKRCILYNENLGYCTGSLRNYGDGRIQSGTYPPPNSNGFIYMSSVDTPFDPVIDPILNTPYNLKIQREGFVEWLVNTQKYKLINAEILENHVGGWVDVFANYGSNPSWFRDVAIQFILSNRISMGVEDISLALSTTKSLYNEYLTLKNDTYRNHLTRRTWNTTDIVPVTNDTDNTLVVDSPNDTIDISILRDILRALINNGNIINDNFNILFDKLENLDNTVNIVNNGGDEPIDFTSLWVYSSDSFDDDYQNFIDNIEEVQSIPMGYINDINQNSLMPENMLEDKTTLTVNVPTITGFTVGNNGNTYSTQTGSYVLRSVDYPWLDTAVQKIKRFASIILIIGYLVHLRYRIADMIRGE